MSVETAKAFMQHIENTEAFASIQDAFDAETKAWDADKLVAHGKTAGFEFSAEDIQAILAADELSDEDLDQIAGGALNLENPDGSDHTDDPWLPASVS